MVFRIKNGVLYEGDDKAKAVIPDDVKEIGESAFSDFKHLKSVAIPNSVKKIDSNAFKGCTSLMRVIIPDSVTKIGEDAFKGTPWLKNLCKNNKGFGIVNNILLKYIKPKRSISGIIIIPDGVTEIGEGTFSCRTSLKSITIPESVTKIGKRAFYDCRNLKSVTIPESVTKIDEFAFGDCKSLEKVITPNFEIKVYGYYKIHEQVCLIALKDFYVTISGKTKYNIIWQMFMQKPDDKDVYAYVKENFIKMLRYAIDKNNVEIITAVCKRKDLLTKRNIDKLIEHAIQHTQNGGTVEIQVILMRYKNDNIGFSEPDFSI